MYGFGKTTAWLLLPAQPGWLGLRMSLTSSSLLFLIILPALLTLPAAWRAMQVPGDLSQVSFPALLGLPGSPQPLLLAAERWHCTSRRWRAALTSAGCRRDTSAAQVHWRLRKLSLLFLMRSKSLQVWHFQSSHFTGKKPWQFITLPWRKRLCLMEMGCTGSACLGGSARGSGTDTGQLAILAAPCWKMAYLSLASSTLCLSVCLSQAVNPLTEEIQKGVLLVL